MYACTVWDPAAQEDTDRLEAIQHRAARFALNWHQKTVSVKQMLQELNWPSMKQCWRTAQLGMLYKINSGLTAIKCPFLKKQPQSLVYPHLNLWLWEDTLSCWLLPQLILPQDSEELKHTSPRDGLSPLHWRLHLEGDQTPVDNDFPTPPPAPPYFLYFLFL